MNGKRSLLRALAALFTAASLVYGAAWLYYFARLTVTPRLGFATEYSVLGRDLLVHTVQAGSAAERSGLRRGDRIIAIDGEPLDTQEPFERWQERGADEAVSLTIAREDADTPIVLNGQFSAARRTPSLRTLAVRAVLPILGSYPVAFLAVGLTVLVRRPEDPYAWLLAMLFGGFVAVPPFTRPIDRLPADLRPVIATYRAVWLSLVPALFYMFFALFPARSPIDRRAAWLKWIGLACGIVLAVPGIPVGHPAPPDILIRWWGSTTVSALRLAYTFPWMGLGLISLVWNAASAPTADARRKTRVLLWGTLVGVVPTFLRQLVEAFTSFRGPYWLAWTTAGLTVVFPVSFGYAVVKHRVLDVPVLLKRSARYLLVRRGFFVLIVALAASTTALFTVSFSRWFSVNVNVAMAIGVAFGVVLAAGSAPLLRRATTRIDYAFFRSAYDARAILEELAESIRMATSRETLATLLERQVREALHPATIAVYLGTSDGELRAQPGSGLATAPAMPARDPWLIMLAERGRPIDVSPRDDDVPAALAVLQAECVVPIVGREGHLTGLVVLGPRLSEESYSGEDNRLLASVAAQASVALENVRLAEEIAERLDSERAAARELDIARQVQARLFPQRRPPLATLEYAGTCVQASRVGGDYFDFLDLGPGRVGLVLADISGKGISGALLMANLQANLRSQYALALDDLPRLLQSVNRLFYENTEENRYATMFFADYADATHVLRYANCGHFPPLLLRAGGRVDQLNSTATVLGLFQTWSTPVVDVRLDEGDLLIVYTDGIIEAANAREEEFGLDRLIEFGRAHRDVPAAALVDMIQSAVMEFTQAPPADDLTVVVARVVRPPRT